MTFMPFGIFKFIVHSSIPFCFVDHVLTFQNLPLLVEVGWPTKLQWLRLLPSRRRAPVRAAYRASSVLGESFLRRNLHHLHGALASRQLMQSAIVRVASGAHRPS